jgi:HD-GYP domain-containing protein (c-di-GMP phosphodiesterase class II)
MKREIVVEDLTVGMFVSELDRPWTGTPFVFQGFLVRTPAHIEALRKYCRTVFIDLERGPDIEERQRPKPDTLDFAAAEFAIRGKAVYRELESVETEFARACDVYDHAGSDVAELLAQVRAGKMLDGKLARDAVARMTGSLVRNPNALMLISRLAHKAEGLEERALNSSIYMIAFGRFLELSRDDLELLGLLGLLQDVGKLDLPDALLAKHTRLSPAEYKVAKSHVQHSVDILRRTPELPARLPEFAALHHERQDGTGYPDRLSGNEIGLFGSIAAIVDAFDAMTMPRPYAAQLSPSQAFGVLYKLRGSAYHATLVEQFCQCIGVYPVGSTVELNTGEVGIVITQNPQRRLKPRVMVVRDAAGHPVKPHKLLDLVKEPKAFADEPYHIRRTLEYGRLQVPPSEFFL